MTTAGGLRLFLDRSTNAKRFAEAARELCPDVQTIGDLYGVAPAENIMDERWIADASAAGRICVGADKVVKVLDGLAGIGRLRCLTRRRCARSDRTER